MRRFETIFTCGLDIAAGNIPTIAHTRGKFKNFTIFCRTCTSCNLEIQIPDRRNNPVWHSDALCLHSANVCTVCTRFFYQFSSTCIKSSCIKKVLQLLLYHVYIRNANFILSNTLKTLILKDLLHYFCNKKHTKH